MYSCVSLTVSAYSQNVLTKNGCKEIFVRESKDGRCVVQGDHTTVSVCCDQKPVSTADTHVKLNEIPALSHT